MVSLLIRGAAAGVTVFFDGSQVATWVATGVTSDTISSEGYVFTYTRDKLFTGGVGLTNPIGRSVRVPWPSGVEAQYVTSGPLPDKARITVRREDGAEFSVSSFTAKLLANAGAGRAIEIVPLLGGEEPLDDPLYFDVSGNYGNQFSYDTSPNHLGSTAALTNYDAYTISLTLDYALTALTLVSAAPDVNHPPTDVSVSGASVPENEPAGTVVGVLATTDADAGDTFTYALVAGAGDGDNGAFAIDGDALVTTASFNFESRTNLRIRVESTEAGGLTGQSALTVAIVDVAESPPGFLSAAGSVSGGLIVRWSSLANHTYTVHGSTNLADGFRVLQGGIPGTPPENAYTDAVPAASPGYWMITTDP